MNKQANDSLLVQIPSFNNKSGRPAVSSFNNSQYQLGRRNSGRVNISMQDQNQSVLLNVPTTSKKYSSINTSFTKDQLPAILTSTTLDSREHSINEKFRRQVNNSRMSISNINSRTPSAVGHNRKNFLYATAKLEENESEQVKVRDSITVRRTLQVPPEIVPTPSSKRVEKRSSLGVPIIITPSASNRQSKANMGRRQLTPQAPADSENSTAGNSRSHSKSSSIEKNRERIPRTRKSYNNRYLAELQPQKDPKRAQQLENINTALMKELEEHKQMNAILTSKNKEYEEEIGKLKTQLELFILDADRPQCLIDAQTRYSNMGEELEYLTDMISNLMQDLDFKEQRFRGVTRDYVTLLNETKSKNDQLKKIDSKGYQFKIQDLHDMISMKEEELAILSSDNSHMLTLLEDYTLKLGEKQDKIDSLESQLKEVQRMLMARGSASNNPRT